MLHKQYRQFLKNFPSMATSTMDINFMWLKNCNNKCLYLKDLLNIVNFL